MFGQKKTSRTASGQKKHDLGMFGLGMDFDPSMGMDGGDDDDEGDLEAELAALQGNQPRKKRPKPKQKLMAISDIDKLAADCMQDVDDVSDDDLEDPDLLAELEGLNPMESNASLDNTPSLVPSATSLDSVSNKTSDVNTISERKTMYETAIANAEKAGEGSKARRYKRGLKEIEKMLKAAKAGNAVNMSELPPAVATGGDKPAPASSTAPVLPAVDTASRVSEKPLIDLGPPANTGSTSTPAAEYKLPPKAPEPAVKPSPVPRSKPPAPARPTTRNTEDRDQASAVKDLTVKRDQYKLAARNSNRDGDKENAKKYLLISKEFDAVIQAVQQGKEVDLSQCPPPPPGFRGGSVSKETTVTSSIQTQAHESSAQLSSTNAASAPPTTGPAPAPKTVLEALEQRLEKYQSGVEDAKKEMNSGRARRMGRIVKQYQEAIRDYKAKKPVNFEELPAPPGYAPIPVDTPSPSPQQAAASRPVPAASPRQPAAAATVPPNRVPPKSAAKKPTPTGRNEKELHFLIARQKEFKMAALNAKKQGDLEAAKKYLKTAKGFDSMIEASQNGLRVDLTNVPESPSFGQSLGQSVTQGNDFVVVREEDCTVDPSNREEVFASLEKALKNQYEMCKKNNQHYSKLGDIDNSKKFQKLAANCKKDYDSIQSAFKHGNPPPRYHYENRTFTVVRSHTDLGDQDCELSVIKCINIPLPSGYSKDDMKVYVSYEFPFPNDQPQTGYTETLKHTINPEFKQSFKLSIDRKNRALARVFRRQGVKLEIKYSRGFLKGDKTLGQASIKLAPFDNKCEIHECVDIMDPDKGRKAIGGKIEAKLRIRQPLTDKDVEIMTEKWLVIDAFVVPSNRPISASSTRQANQSNDGKTKSANVSKVCVIE